MKQKKIIKDSLIVLITGIALAYLSCNKEQLTGSDVGNEDAIALSGRVLNKNGDGIANVVVKLSRIGFADTTNAQGSYKISASKDTLISLGIQLDNRIDSVVVQKDNAVITKMKVEKWIDSLPDVYIIQRNVSGRLLTTNKEFKWIREDCQVGMGYWKYRDLCGNCNEYVEFS
jgi:hypothetical protein